MTLFSNQSVPIDALPTLLEEEFEGLPVRYRTLRAAVYAGVMLLLFAAMGPDVFRMAAVNTFRWGVWVAGALFRSSVWFGRSRKSKDFHCVVCLCANTI